MKEVPEVPTASPVEQKEALKAYDLYITLTRHGPKVGPDDPLSETGRGETGDYFRESYAGVPIDTSVRRQVISSPKERALETADIYQRELQQYNEANVRPVEIDDRLSEGKNILKFNDSLPPSERRKWFKHWFLAKTTNMPDVIVGKDVVMRFAQWLLEKIQHQKKDGGKLEIDAFSHGPLMAAFMLALEDKLGVEILLSERESGDRYNRDVILENEMTFLKNMNFHASSTEPETIDLVYAGRVVKIPRSVLAELAEHYEPKEH